MGAVYSPEAANARGWRQGSFEQFGHRFVNTAWPRKITDGGRMNEKRAEDYREMAEECMAEAQTLTGDGTLSDREFLESMARKDRLIDHEDNCGHCYTLVCMAE